MYLWIPCPVGIGSTDFALSVLQQTGVVCTPGNAFGLQVEVRADEFDCRLRSPRSAAPVQTTNICYSGEALVTGVE